MSLSKRGQKAIQPALSYFGKFLEGSKYLYDRTLRPDGYVLLAVAENRQTFPMMASKLLECRGVDPGVGAYDNMCGRERFRNAFANLMNSTAIRARVHPDHLVVGSGCGGLINELAFLLADQGDACLLPTPTYGALYNDFHVLADVCVVDVPLDARDEYKLSVDKLEEGHARARREGRTPRILFLINPCNPLGIVYPGEDLLACISWARGKGMHTVIDEIYANTVWGEGGREFTSALDICAPTGGLGNDVHILWGMSKDFALSGARCGLLYTHNEALLQAESNCNYFTTVANSVQDELARMCEDVEWVKSFFAATHADCRASSSLVTSTCAALSIPCTPHTAGMFAWLDLREFLPPPSAAGQRQRVQPGDVPDFTSERELVELLWQECKLLMTPGEACHAGEPGYFRACFVWMEREALEAGMERLKAFVLKTRQQRQSVHP